MIQKAHGEGYLLRCRIVPVSAPRSPMVQRVTVGTPSERNVRMRLIGRLTSSIDIILMRFLAN